MTQGIQSQSTPNHAMDVTDVDAVEIDFAAERRLTLQHLNDNDSIITWADWLVFDVSYDCAALKR